MGLFKKRPGAAAFDSGRVPRHVGIIMDGNGRWAGKRGMPRSVGHRAGAQALKRITLYCDKIGIKVLTVYAFSTENWKRPQKEVDSLISLMKEYLSNAEEDLGGKNVVIRVIGDLSPFSEDMHAQIRQTEKLTENNSGMTLNIALNYGGQYELVNAVRSIVKSGLKPGEINGDTVEKYLYTAGNPPVDLIIRPSGEFRLSNFMLWQCAYAELWFSDVLWPDFTEKHMAKAIWDFQQRDRRYGKV